MNEAEAYTLYEGICHRLMYIGDEKIKEIIKDLVKLYSAASFSSIPSKMKDIKSQEIPTPPYKDNNLVALEDKVRKLEGEIISLSGQVKRHDETITELVSSIIGLNFNRKVEMYDQVFRKIREALECHIA